MTHCKEQLSLKLIEQRGYTKWHTEASNAIRTDKEVIESQERRKRRSFSLSGAVFILLWFISSLLFLFLLLFACFFFCFLSWGDEIGMRGWWGVREVNRIGVHDEKPPKIQQRMLKKIVGILGMCLYLLIHLTKS